MEIITFVPVDPEDTDAPAFSVAQISTGNFRVDRVEKSGDIQTEPEICFSFADAIRTAGRLMVDQLPVEYEIEGSE